jgi:hypothetical protein
MAILPRAASALHAVAQAPPKRWRGLLELAGVGGVLCAVDVRIHMRGHPPVPSLADLHLDRDVAQLHLVDPEAHIVLPFPGLSCDALVFGPRIGHLDEASRETLLDESLRVVRRRGFVMLVVPAGEPAGLLWAPPLEWLPGAPQGWWSDPVGDRFEEVRHAPFSRRLSVVLARQTCGPAVSA